MRSVFSVTSLALSLLLVVAGAGCKEEVPAPAAVEESAALEEPATEPAAVAKATEPTPAAVKEAGSPASAKPSALVPVAAGKAAKPARRDIVNTAKKRYSQFGEELCIRDFFQDRRDGFFLDVGCAFPQRNSTTFYLDKHLGWTGIGVDAVSTYAKHWAKDRPDSKFLNFLISDHSDTEDTFYRAKWPEVSSAIKEMVETPAGLDQPYDYTEIKVRTITIDKLLEDNGIEKIDFMSMDIEGFQMTALAAFDIQKYQPELVCIEAYRPDRPKINAWFEERGYKRIDRYLKHDHINWYYTPADNPALLIE